MTAHMRHLFALLLILSLAGCIARPVCGWQGYTISALATAEAGVRYMDWRGDVVCAGGE